MKSLQLIFLQVCLLIMAACGPTGPRVVQKEGYASLKDDLTGLSVYRINELDTLPLCNGDSFTEGFGKEFARRFHPEPRDDNPFRFSVQFVIDKNGKLVGPRVKTPSSDFYKSSDDQLTAYEKHVLETVNQIHNWEPGKVDGSPVNVLLTVPIIF